tara:strand:+ start:3847 stop:6528 length:2682 start_codon:yes stop_codon:yes gene_type:complete
MPLPHSHGYGPIGAGHATGGSAPVSPPVSPPATGSILSITPTASSYNEGGTAVFNITTSNMANGTSLSYQIVTGGNAYPAAALSDFDTATNPTSGSVTINSNAGQISFDIDADLTTEGLEQFRASVTYSVTSQTMTSSYVTISDTSTTPVVPAITSVVGPSSIVEGTSGTITVNTVNIPDGTLLNWAITHNELGLGPVSATGEYSLTSDTVEITGNSGQFDITPVDDATSESNEYGFVTVSGTVSGTAVSEDSNDIDIIDAAQPTITSVARGDTSIEEGNSTTFTVNTANISNGTALNWSINNVSSENADFSTTSAAGGTVTINSNSGQVTIDTVADSDTAEGDETFKLDVSGTVNAASVSGSSASVTIEDKTPQILSIVGSATITEAGTGNYFGYLVSTANIADGTVLNWAVNHISTAAADFGGNGTSGTVTINSNTGTIQIDIDEDEVTEGNQTFTLTASGSVPHPNDGTVNVSVTKTSSTITITDTSTQPSLSISSTPVQGNETNFNSMTWTITAAGFDNGASIAWVVNHGSTQAADFTATSGSETLSGTTCDITIEAVEDFLTESAETFTFTVSGTSAGGSSISQTSHTVTIYSTSQTPSISSVSGPSSIDEGASGDFNVTTVNVPNTTSLNWQVVHTDTTAADFPVVSQSGTVTINSNSGTIPISPTADAITEGAEDFFVRVSGTAGPNNTAVTKDSAACTVNDTSQATAGMDSSFSIYGGSQTEDGPAGAFVEAHVNVVFTHDAANNRIKIRSTKGGSQTTAVAINSYVNYVGLNNITSIRAKYTVSSQACSGTCYVGGWGPTPVNDGYNTGTYYPSGSTIGAYHNFGWMAKSNPNLQSTSTTMVNAFGVQMTIQVIDSVEGTFLAASNSMDVSLQSTEYNGGGGMV